MIPSLRRIGCGLLVAGFLCGRGGAGVSSVVGAGQHATRDQLPSVLTDALARVRAGDAAGARPLFEQVIAEARGRGDARSEAEARRGLAMVLYREHRWDECGDEMTAALSLFEQLGDHQTAAAVAHARGNLAFERGSRPAAARDFRLAIRHAAAVGDRRYQASLAYNLCLSLEPGPAIDPEVADGLRVASETGSRRFAGQLHHCLGDQRFLQGRFLDALTELQEASALLGASGEEGRLPLTRVWISLGRLHRVHGRMDDAVGFYERALAVQEQAGDLVAAAQSCNAIGVARGLQGRTLDAGAAFERAIDRARRSGSLAATTFQTVNLARWLIHTGQAARGVRMLEAVADSPALADRENYHAALAYGWLALNQAERAERAATMSLAVGLDADRRVQGLTLRARARRALGRQDLALEDARDAVRAIERLRAGAVPGDAMKLAFGAAYAETFSLAIALLADRGLHAESLAVAEQGRARALADILATRDLSRAAAAGTTGPAGPPPVALLSAPPGAAGLEPPGRGQAYDPESAATPALALADVVALARRLRSTVVAYWVAPDDTFIWAVRQDGTLAGARTHVSRARIERLVRAVWTLPGTRSRGAPAEDEDAGPPRSSGSASQPGSPRPDLDVPAGGSRAALRELYRLLIHPVEAHLPAETGGRLTIVPHGPLFSLSFAALRDAAGRYLVERYALHYGASGAVLDQATRLPEARAAGPARYVLVADPSSPPLAPDGQSLPTLPGSRREVMGISEVLPASQVTILEGSRASEEGIGGAVSGGRVLHFAVHAIVLDGQPQASHLALSRPLPRSGGRVPSSGDRVVSSIDPQDGRLTADEVYNLRLDADVVVLSACRSGLGEISGDGMVGLTRAFLVAGARSVVAALWDVADEPAARLMPAFYRARLAGADKSAALREAQLTLLQALRAGKLSVATPRGPRVLPEHPVFWAAFVLIGEP